MSGLLKPFRASWMRGRSGDEIVFHRARLQLTAWYALTLAIIVLAFSGIIYGILAARLHGYQHEREPVRERQVERETTAFALGELRVYLVIGNLALLTLGVAGAYLLAGRTLQPIARSMARQRRFAADASHELRTPLAAMRGTIDVALQRSRSAASYRAVLQEVGEEVDTMTALTEQLLWLARGGSPGAADMTDVRAVIAEAVRQNAPLAAERERIVTIEPGDPLFAVVDAALLRQVLSNLVNNALRHTPAGTSVAMRAERLGKALRVQISDNGPGIPEGERLNVLQPFYRLRTTGADGHGLGLALTRELVSALGGSIHIGETPGGGTTVSVWIPCGVAETAEELGLFGAKHERHPGKPPCRLA